MLVEKGQEVGETFSSKLKDIKFPILDNSDAGMNGTCLLIFLAPLRWLQPATFQAFALNLGSHGEIFGTVIAVRR